MGASMSRLLPQHCKAGTRSLDNVWRVAGQLHYGTVRNYSYARYDRICATLERWKAVITCRVTVVYRLLFTRVRVRSRGDICERHQLLDRWARHLPRPPRSALNLTTSIRDSRRWKTLDAYLGFGGATAIGRGMTGGWGIMALRTFLYHSSHTPPPDVMNMNPKAQKNA